MKIAPIDQLIHRLHRELRLLHLEVIHYADSWTIIEGYYFSYDFTVYIQASEHQFIINIHGNRKSRSFYGIDLSEIIRHLKQLVVDHPFDIVRYQRGQYRLLDPDGFDYIGELVTLQDAKRTCYGNFVYSG